MTPRWMATALVILVLAGVCVQLGRWQLHRLDERKARNEVTRSNLAAPPAPLIDIVGPQRVVGEPHDWRTGVVSGRYDESKQVVLRYRNVKDQPGFEIVTPLILRDGTAVLVDRGFLEREGASLNPPTIPPAPTGEVTVTGRLRRSERGGSTTGGTPVDGTARLISGPQFGRVLGLNLVDGYLTVDRQEPAADPAFGSLPGPEIDNGPHFFYAVQWFFFALLALGGLIYFSREDVRGDHSAPEGHGRDSTGDPDPAPESRGGAQSGPEPASATAGPADRGLRPDRRHADSGTGLD
jgi:cytochrome oxidase assembly protein ShyY1